MMDAIHLAFEDAFENTAQHEPQLVANLVWHLPKQLNSITLSSKGNSLKTGGVFVHAQPFVRADSFPKTKPESVEIGDLLLLRTAYQAETLIDRRAMLLQAKKTANLSARLYNENQHYLYAHWPIFEYVQSTPRLKGQKRHIKGLDVYDATKFLLIANGPLLFSPCCCGSAPFLRHYCLRHHCFGHCPALTAHPTEPCLSHHRCFAMDLLDFIFGASGKTYNEEFHHRVNGWDKVIEDLTKITAKRNSVFMERASGRVSRKRGELMFALLPHEGMPSFSRFSHLELCAPDITGMDGPPSVPDSNYGEDGEEERGISILEFAININSEGAPRE
ncbi:hypothetical protein [Aminirod propionatiphilus]|uniref:Uncharacterized protein n=1 Tax=Aminirod propionatiphilus TaxID=3415223 RepID=A0ACD1DX41_9BACT|nr:hypothetical protein KIH16_02930 [Synergistota bacterium]